MFRGGGSGTPGAPGAPGTQWIGITAPPVDADGQPDGTINYYVTTNPDDPLAGNTWQKIAGAYVLNNSLQGPPGAAAGSTTQGPIPITTSAPSSSLGNTGDSAANTVNGQMWTPKGGISSRSPLHVFGINTHMSLSTGGPNVTNTSAQWIALLNDLGADVIRDNVASGTILSNNVSKYNDLWAAGIWTYFVNDQSPSMTNSYATNYSLAYTAGQAWGTASLAYNGPVYVEWSNEWDAKGGTPPAGARRQNGTTTYAGSINPNHLDGSVYGDYDPNRIEALRGWIAGGLAGVKNTNPAAKVGVAWGGSFPNVITDIMYNGRGTADGPTVPGIGGYTNGAVIATPIPLDFVGVHWYWTQFNPTAAQSWHYTYSGAGIFNVLSLLQSVAPIPVFISEWGGGSQVDSSKSSSTTSYFNSYWGTSSFRTTYNIAGIMYYNIYQLPTTETSANNYGIIQNDGVTKQVTYSTLQGLYKNNTTSTPGGWSANPTFQMPTWGGTGLADQFTASNTPMKIRIWNQGDKTNGDWAYVGFNADNIVRLNSSKVGTGTARALQLGFNDVDLLKLNASSFTPLTNNSYMAGSTTLRFSNVQTNLIATAQQEYTSTGTLVTTSPQMSIINSAGAVNLTFPSGNDGDERIVFNLGSSTTALISYTGSAGATTYTFTGGTGKWIRLKYLATPTSGSARNYWIVIGSN